MSETNTPSQLPPMSDECRKLLERALKIIEDLQWDSCDQCRECFNYCDKGHAANCKHAIAIKDIKMTLELAQ